MQLGEYVNENELFEGGIKVNNIRNTTPTPGMFGDRVMNVYFHNDGFKDWKSILSMSGWTAKSEKYATHELAFNATNGVSDKNLYHRTGIEDTWQSWRTILDSYNFGDYAVPRVGEMITSLPSNWDSMMFTTGTTKIHDRISEWSKGILITSGGGDAGLISVDVNNTLSWGFRDKGNWVGIQRLGANKKLWSGGHYMTEDQTIYLSEAVSSQVNGIILTFEAYRDGAAKNYEYHHFFVPKTFVTNTDGVGSNFVMTAPNFTYNCTKYLYIKDTSIVGNYRNVSTGTNQGVSFTNHAFVLSGVYGV